MGRELTTLGSVVRRGRRIPRLRRSTTMRVGWTRRNDPRCAVDTAPGSPDV